MFTDFTLHKIIFLDSLYQIERLNWNDFDYHREDFNPTLSKIKIIKWVKFDSEKYDKIFNKVVDDTDIFLRSSRYVHRSFTKCFPTSDTCRECFKYFCGCCDSGTNCMYGELHNNRRCSRIIEKYYSDIYNISSIPKSVFMYGEPEFELNKKNVFCPREIYGY